MGASGRARFNLRNLASKITLIGLFASILTFVTPLVNSETAAAAGKVTICHRTHSVTNPYRMITVSNNAVNRARGHKVHTGGVFVTTAGHYVTDGGSNAKVWGDIIPGGDADGLVYNGANSIAENWTTAGKAFFPGGANAGRCGKMTAKQFYDIEVAAGELAADILLDLNEQDANEDAALKTLLGGSFTGANISTSSSVIMDTTTAATLVGHNSATLNGDLKPGGATVQWRFRYGLNNDLSGSTTQTTLSSNVTTTQSVSTSISSLTPNTTYYFQVEMVTDPGLETEGVITGGILSFKTDALLTLTAASKSAFVGDPTPTWTYTVSGLQGSDTFTAVAFSFEGVSPTVYSASATPPTTAAAGVYTISITGQTFGTGDANNYSITYVAGEYVVNAAGALNQTISLPSISNRTYGDPNFLISSTTSDDTSTAIALLVGLSSTTPSVCTAATSYRTGTTSYDTITIVAAGTCTIRAVQTGGNDGTNDYAAATNSGVTASFTINPAPLTITAGSKTINVGDSSPTWTYTNTALVNGETIASLVYTFTGTGSTTYGPSTSNPSTSAAATFGIRPSSVSLASSALTSNYTITYVDGTYTINAVVVTPPPPVDIAPVAPVVPPVVPPVVKPEEKPVASPKFKPIDSKKVITPKAKDDENNPAPVTGPKRFTPEIPKATIELFDENDESSPIAEAKSKSPVKTEIDPAGKLELIIPTGFKGPIEVELKSKVNPESEIVTLQVEGPKPPVELRPELVNAPRILEPRPGVIDVVGLNGKVTLSWKPDEKAVAYEIKRDGETVCLTVYTTCIVPAQNRVTKEYSAEVVTETGEKQAIATGGGAALKAGTLLAIVYFNTDKSGIRADARETLNKLVNDLFVLGLRNVSLSGHTDTQASKEYNARLSAKRSKTISEFLKGAVIDSKLARASFSENRLVVPTEDQVDEQQNRRVEIRVAG